MSKKKIVVFGTSETAQIANYYFDTDSNYEVVAFANDAAYLMQTQFEDKPLVAFEDIGTLYPPADYKMFVALRYQQMTELRDTKYNDAKSKGYTLVSYTSSNCNYLSQYPCGDNCFILENNTIQPFVTIGNNVVLWSGNHKGHHSVINDRNYISSQVVVLGHCTIHSYSYLGINTTLAHQVSIATETLLQNGAVMSKNTEANKAYTPPASMLLDKRRNEITL